MESDNLSIIYRAKQEHMANVLKDHIETESSPKRLRWKRKLIIFTVIIVFFCVGYFYMRGNVIDAQNEYIGYLKKLELAQSDINSLVENQPASSTTMTQEQWDTYYSGVTSQLQTDEGILPMDDFGSPYIDTMSVQKINSYKNLIASFLPLQKQTIDLAKSHTDLNFTIMTETGQNGILSAQERQILAEELIIGNGDKSLINAFEAQVKKDNDSYSAQTKQLADLITQRNHLTAQSSEEWITLDKTGLVPTQYKVFRIF